MLLYAKYGKFRHKDRILNLINWSGNEIVLDVGTGLGLLMNGEAKRLTTGKAIGIDIWNKEDLSKNDAHSGLTPGIDPGNMIQFPPVPRPKPFGERGQEESRNVKGGTKAGARLFLW